MSRELTHDQEIAVTTLNGDLAVRAGAGSGKTRVLAYRFSSALAEHEGWSPADLDQILTITFTNKAAGEIAERVRRVVTQELTAAQGRRVGEAWISTIHSLCGRLVRRHVLEAGVEPQFGLADEVTTKTLMTEAFERAARRLYESDTGVVRALEIFSVDRLRDYVVSCHDNARSLGLDPASISVPAGEGEAYHWVERLRGSADKLASSLECAKQTPSVTSKGARLSEWRGSVDNCLADDDRCQSILSACLQFDIQRPPEEAKEDHASMKAELEAVISAATAATERELLSGIEHLMRAFATEYRDVKAEKGVLDFDDLQERAVALLERDPAIAERYREAFRLIMVDEFQDTNELQMRVLAPLRRDNLCVVGDERQSIYGFRYADVEIFGRESAAMDRPAIELKQNFRSHADVLDFVNAVFSQDHLFGSSFMQLEAGRPAREDAEYVCGEPRVRCLFVGTDDSKKPEAVKVEAARVAEEIDRLISRGARGSDVAILVRASTHVGSFAEALERRGIPVLINAGVGLMDAPEVSEVMHLLRAIAVPADDEALLAVLSGRMVNVSDDALLAVSRASGKRPLWKGLEAIAAGEAPVLTTKDDTEALAAAYHALCGLSEQQGSMRLADLVFAACEAFDYDITLHAEGPGGVRAWANVGKIARYGEAFEAAESNDLAEFVAYLAERGEAATDKAAPAEAGDDAVHLMTVHAAKGLEYPIVFVVDLATAQKHSMPPVLVGKGASEGEVVPVVGVRLPEECGRASTAEYQRMATSRTEREIEEEKRCLYVACTRAKEMLYLSGCTTLGKPGEECGGLIDWVRTALDDAEPGEIELGAVPVRVEHLYPEAQVDDATESKTLPREPGSFAPGTTAERPPEVVPRLPQTVSYSALHLFQACSLGFHARHVLRLGVLRRPKTSSATDFGSAVHAALQSAAPEEIGQGRATAIASRFGLGAEDAERLVNILRRFSASELAATMRASHRVGREEPLYVDLGEAALVGSIDVISWSGSKALVIDYKTGKAPVPGDQRRAEGYELQARCYALAALSAGAEAVEVVFTFVEHDVVLRFDFKRSDLGALRESIAGLLGRIESEPIGHLAEYDEEVCSDCPALGGMCPIRPPAWRTAAG